MDIYGGLSPVLFIECHKLLASGANLMALSLFLLRMGVAYLT